MNSKAKEPITAPPSEQWFPLSLGSSFTDDPSASSSRFYSLRYEFKPASIDTTRPGTLSKNAENKVTVEFCNNQAGKPKVSFQGNSEDCRELDGVIFFDGKSFRLERLHKAIKSLRHVRLPGESSNVSSSNASVIGGGGASATEPATSPGHLNGASIPSGLSSIPPNVSVERINPLVQAEEIPTSQITQTETPAEKKSAKRKADTSSSASTTAKVTTKGRISPPAVPVESALPPAPAPASQPPRIETKIDDYSEDVDVEIEANEEDDESSKKITKALDPPQHEVNIDDEIVSDYEMIEDVDVSEDDGVNPAEVLRAQAQAQAAADQKQESSSSGSSGSGSGSSGSESGSGSGSGSGSSSSGSGSDDDDDSASSAEDI